MAESKYVARGRLLVLEKDPNAREELEKMNKKKVGAPYRHAESVFMALASIRCMTGASCENLEGLARQALGDDDAPGHAHTCRRINGIKVDIREGMVMASGKMRAIRMAAGPSGLRRNDRGERTRKKWKLGRGFVKVHMLVEVRTRRVLALRVTDVRTRRVLALRVTDVRTGDSPMFEPLVTEATAALDRAEARAKALGGKEAEEAAENAAEAKGDEDAAIAAEAVRAASEEAAAARAVAAGAGGTAREREPEASVSAAAVASAAGGGAGRITCADGAYASRKNIAPCRELGVVPFIKMNKTATTAGKGEGDGRGRAVRERPGFGARYVSDMTAGEKATSMEARKAASGYGRRRAAETVFAALKRLFGSGARSLKWGNTVQEVNLKASLYNRMVSMAAGGTG